MFTYLFGYTFIFISCCDNFCVAAAALTTRIASDWQATCNKNVCPTQSRSS